ncbi:helix-turn-helix domain-containing protein [Tautonia plasticadhaerens]|uniref:hypothetical protein n=1 Tax=Tautonia plasticadhaerens TaxID=2527974 RepID=UPI0018D26574|nr:hypothetical protein [Tautonia plasticadhaerens]
MHSHLSDEKVDSLLEHLAEGCGVRQTGRLVKGHRDTVMRYGCLAGQHAHDAHDELVDFSLSTREAQFDEKWSLVAKKQAHCDPADEQKGGWWDHVG